MSSAIHNIVIVSLCDNAVPYSNALFVLAANLGFGHWSGHIALAARTGLRAVPAVSSPPLIGYTFFPPIMPSSTFKEALGRYTYHAVTSQKGVPDATRVK